MDFGELIQTHGYWVLMLGCLLEGETVLAMAGFAAHRGHLDFAWVLVVAAASGFAGDLFFFWLGRRHGTRMVERFPSLARLSSGMQAAVEKYHAWIVVGVRFAYGLRIAGPILIGTSKLRWSQFLRFNALGAALWAVGIAGIGWTFGQALEALLGDMRHVEGWLFGGLATLGLGYWWWTRRRRSRVVAVSRAKNAEVPRSPGGPSVD